MSPTPKDTFELATIGGRIPIGVAAGIAWLESHWDPAARTGRHVGLFQLVDSPENSIYGDWLANNGPKIEDLSDPSANAAVAGWALVRVAEEIRRSLEKSKIALPPKVFWPLVYWAWLAGTSDVPRVVASYAKWLAKNRADSVIPLRRLVQEAELRISAEGRLWKHISGLSLGDRWRPETIRTVLESGAIAPKLAREFVRSVEKARHAFKLAPWVTRSWKEIVKAIGPEFEKFYKRPITAPWPALKALGVGALLGALLFAYLLLRR